MVVCISSIMISDIQQGEQNVVSDFLAVTETGEFPSIWSDLRLRAVDDDDEDLDEEDDFDDEDLDEEEDFDDEDLGEEDDLDEEDDEDLDDEDLDEEEE